MRRLQIALLAALLAPSLACESKPEMTPEELQARIASKIEEADVRLRNNKAKDAEEIYNWVLQQEPQNARALRGLALVRYEEDDIKAAEDFATKAAAANGEDHEVQAVLGKIYDKTERYAEAATAWGKAFELEPDNSRYGLAQGNALRNAKNLDEAEKVLRKVADLDPEVQFVYTDLGDTLREKGELDEALKLYMKAQTIFASDRRAFAGAAQVYEQKGDTTNAINQWSTYIRMDCCSNYSNDTAKPKLEALRQKEQEELAGEQPTVVDDEGDQAG